MTENDQTQTKDGAEGFFAWMLWIMGSAAVLYLLGFALLVLFPGVHQAVRAIGLSADTLQRMPVG